MERQERIEFYPYVRFQLPSPLLGQEYYLWLFDLMDQFLIQIGSRTSVHDGLNSRPEAESGINLQGTVARTIYSKVFWHDGSYQGRKGITFRLHLGDDDLFCTPGILRLGDAFEAFLKRRGTAFQRYQHKIDRKNEVEVSKS